MSPEPKIPRKYPRVRAPKGMWVGWKSAKQTCTSLAEVMGMGGLFLHTANPASEGSSIDLIFDLPNGQVRARAIVRSFQPGKGMGIQFVQMRPEDRAKLNRYLSAIEIPVGAEEPDVIPAGSAKPAQLAFRTRASRHFGTPRRGGATPFRARTSPTDRTNRQSHLLPASRRDFRISHQPA